MDHVVSERRLGFGERRHQHGALGQLGSRVEPGREDLLARPHDWSDRELLPGVGRAPNTVGLTYLVGEDFRQIVASGTTLFASSFSGWFIAYDLPSRKELWRVVNTNGAANASALVSDGSFVYVVNGNGHLCAMSAKSPQMVWDFGSFQDGFVASVALAQNRVFVSGITGFWAIDKP
jgi:hypothetical protein